MFDNLSERLQGTIKRLRGRGRITDDNMREALREVRMALLEADVALPVAKAFVEDVKKKASGKEVLTSLSPGQAVVKIVHDELVHLMGDENDRLNLSVRPPAVILMAGLQGAGKTTTVAKLARRLIVNEKKSVLVTSADIYRPAAIEQLRRLASEVGAEFFPSQSSDKPVEIATGAIAEAARRVIDVVIIDTAGRLHIDDEMMAEIQDVHAAANPVETLFVADSMTGQDAVNSARAFDKALSLTGVILTKADGDARGGAALSIRHVTGKPIKFLGVGEKTDALEPFYPDRLAGRILGMGDVVSLVEDIQQKVDVVETERLAKKLKSGKKFTLEDFRDQIMQMENLGGISGMMNKMPGMGAMAGAAQEQAAAGQMKGILAIINSMTLHERQFPDVIRGSRKRRIAAGSGTQVQEVNRMLKQFGQMQKMMKKFKKGGVKNALRGIKGLPGMPF
ncbi:MAG: signal recognition particle protein [Acidiferrobacterales bacterium]